MRPILFLGLLAVLSIGCSEKVGTEYGYSLGKVAGNSPAGISEFRTYLQEQGRNTFSLKYLSVPAGKLDAIVWMPSDFGVPSSSSQVWFEAWLDAGKNRTLIYVGRDYSPLQTYWRRAVDQASADKRAEMREECAYEEFAYEELQSRFKNSKEQKWFYYRYREIPIEGGKVQGPWADAWQVPVYLRSGPAPRDQFTPEKIESIEVEEKARDDELAEISNVQKAMVVPTPGTPSSGTTSSGTTGSNSSNGGTSTSPSPPSAPPTNSPAGKKPIVTPNPQKKPNTFSPFAIEDEEVTIEETSRYEFKVLAETAQGETLAFEVTRPEWDGGKIIILANSSPICNLGMAMSDGMGIAAPLLSAIPPKSRVGFLETDHSPFNRFDEDEEQSLKGFEALTEWPLNLISFHAVMLGVLVMVSMLPIFGRGRVLQKRSTRDFGQHVEALGNLLYATRDRSHALKAVADYFRLVRNEPSSPWATVAMTASLPSDSTAPPIQPTPSVLQPTISQENAPASLSQSGSPIESPKTLAPSTLAPNTWAEFEKSPESASKDTEEKKS